MSWSGFNMKPGGTQAFKATTTCSQTLAWHITCKFKQRFSSQDQCTVFCESRQPISIYASNQIQPDVHSAGRRTALWETTVGGGGSALSSFASSCLTPAQQLQQVNITACAMVCHTGHIHALLPSCSPLPGMLPSLCQAWFFLSATVSS